MLTDDLTEWLTRIWREDHARLSADTFCGPPWPTTANLLARIEVERKIFELHQPQWNESSHIDNDFYGCLLCVEANLCDTVKLLASIHADRPGYREGWRP